MRSRLAAVFRRFLNTESAASAVEFAFVAPLFIAMVLAVGQIGLYFFYSASLVRATDAAVRLILVGTAANTTQVVGGNTTTITGAYFREKMLCPQLPGGMSCDNVIDNIQVIDPMTTTFASLENAQGTGLQAPASMNNANTTFCIGGSGSVVAVQIYYAMPVLGLPWLTNGSTFNGQNVVFISATAVFKNEPFSINNGFGGCAGNA